MKVATFRRRRTHPIRGDEVWVPQCPFCKTPHWLPSGTTGTCVRRNRQRFAIQEAAR